MCICGRSVVLCAHECRCAWRPEKEVGSLGGCESLGVDSRNWILVPCKSECSPFVGKEAIFFTHFLQLDPYQWNVRILAKDNYTFILNIKVQRNTALFVRIYLLLHRVAGIWGPFQRHLVIIRVATVESHIYHNGEFKHWISYVIYCQ